MTEPMNLDFACCPFLVCAQLVAKNLSFLLRTAKTSIRLGGHQADQSSLGAELISLHSLQRKR